MPYKSPRKLTYCSKCPLSSQPKVWGYSDTDKPLIAFIGSYPDRKDSQLQVAFSGYTHNILKSTLVSLGKKIYHSHCTFVLPCAPYKAKSIETDDAVMCCHTGLLEELKELKKKGVKVLVPLGDMAASKLGVDGSLSKVRGSIYMLKLSGAGISTTTDITDYDFLCVPTFDEMFLQSGMLKHEVSFINDIEKAIALTEKPYKPPKENFLLYPTIKDIEKRTKEILKSKLEIAVDIETTGLVPGKARILMVGIATTEEDAFVIPFIKQGGLNYWTNTMDRMKAHQCVKDLMAKTPTIFQNCLFDMRHLEHFGAPVLNLKHDTMILHHCISPELPHNLGYIVSVYGKTPYWKDEVLSSPDKMMHMPDETVRTYNLRDCVTLKQILPELIVDAKENNTYYIYENISMPLVKPIMALMRNGVKVDDKALIKWKKDLNTTLKTCSENLYSIASLPESFNFSSGDHMRLLLFGQVPARYERIQKELEKYNEPGCKLKTNTKKYQALIEDYKLFGSVKPFPEVRHIKKKTETGQLSVDDEAILNLQTAVTNRINTISKLKRPTLEHKEELKALNNLIEFIKNYRLYVETNKLKTTYTYFPVDKDNRVRFPYRITGTATGRLSSGDKKAGEAGNAQNFPKKVKHIFVPEKGSVIVQGDYSNLELRVMAEISNDSVLKGMFKKGLNIHSENCKLLFGIDEEHPMWDTARRACKTYIFGRNYGGGPKGIHRQLLQQVPELNLTYEKFCDLDEKYRKAHPAYVTWRNVLISKVHRERCLENAFGRKRYFLGGAIEIEREGLNFPIQSTAGDIFNFALIRVQKAIDNKKLNATMIVTVHDSIVFEVPKKGLKATIKQIKSLMEEPVKIGNQKVLFPVDIEVGDTWGSLEKYE